MRSTATRLRHMCALLLIGVWVAAELGCRKPPLRVITTSSGVTVDVQTLGEYQTTINRVRLTDVERRSVVWEIMAQGGTAQFHAFSLVAGSNEALPFEAAHGSYDVVAPKGDGGLQLESDRKYRIEVWGESGRPATVEFVL